MMPHDAQLLPHKSIGFSIANAIACALAATAALTWLAVDGVKYLPTLYVNLALQTLFASYIDIFLWALNIVTSVVLFVRKRTALDFCLMIVLFARWPDFLVAAFYTVIFLAPRRLLSPVEDSVPRIEPKTATGIFDAFVTTKANGIGLGHISDDC